MTVPLIDGTRHAAVIDYARRLLRQADAPDLTADERAELLAEARAAEARAFAIREGRG